MPLDPKTNAQIAALAPVQSVNGETGAVSLSAADVSAQASDATLSALASWDWSSGVEVPTFTADDTLAILRVGTGANNLVQLDGTGKLPVVDGSALTNLPAGTIADGSITNAKLANVATATIKGRTTAGTGVPEDLTASQARTVLGLGTAALSATTAFEAAGSIATHAALASGVHGNYHAALSSDYNLASASTNYDVLTLNLPTAGYWLVQYSATIYRSVAAIVTPRIISGTAVLGGTTASQSGWGFGGGAFTQSTLTKGSPDVFSLRASNSTVNGGIAGWGIIVEVTTPGTIILQMQSSSTDHTIRAGGYMEAFLT